MRKLVIVGQIIGNYLSPKGNNAVCIEPIIHQAQSLAEKNCNEVWDGHEPRNPTSRQAILQTSFIQWKTCQYTKASQVEFVGPAAKFLGNSTCLSLTSTVHLNPRGQVNLIYGRDYLFGGCYRVLDSSRHQGLFWNIQDPGIQVMYKDRIKCEGGDVRTYIKDSLYCMDWNVQSDHELIDLI